MRSLAVTAFVAFLVGCGGAAACWTVEASALPRPAPGDRAAVDGLVVLDHHREVESVISIGGRPAVRGSCERGWFPRRGTLLTLGDGARVFAAAHALVSAQARAELELGGCPRVLAGALARLLQNGARATTTRVWFGRPALAIRVASLTLYVTPAHNVPIGVGIRSPALTGRTRFRFAS
jgi:hypothetical protein